MYVINFPIYICHQIPDEYIVQKQPPVMFFRSATLLKKDANTGISCEHCKIFKNSYFEKHMRTPASDSSYILHKKWNKIIQEPDWPFVSF